MSRNRDIVSQRWGDDGSSTETARLHWMASLVIQGYVNQRVTGDPFCDWLTWSRNRWLRHTGTRVLVLGCGEGWVERALAADPRVGVIDACDIAEGAVARARATAREQGLESIQYSVVDLDHDPLPDRGYDLVVAHASLHHVSHLEELYQKLAVAMKPDAFFLANEYVGPRRLQFPPSQMARIARTFSLLPRCYRLSGSTGEEVFTKEQPDEDDVVATDPSESVRSHEVFPLLSERFTVAHRRDFGGALLQHLLWDIVPNFDHFNARDNRVLALICLLEQSLESRGELSSDFTFVVARNQPPDNDCPTPTISTSPPQAVPIWLLPGYLAATDVASNSMTTRPRSSNLDSEMAALLLGMPAEDGTANLRHALHS